MMAEPQLHEGHEHLSIGVVGTVEVVSLFLPLLAKLTAHLLEEDGELIKLLLTLGGVEEIEFGVIENLVLLRPHVAF